MTSAESAALEPARKRQRLSQPSPSRTTSASFSEARRNSPTDTTVSSPSPNFIQSTSSEEMEREAKAGILQFVNETNPGFSGILKQRYTDFLVNEITPEGHVLHLTNLNPPKPSHVKDAPKDTKAPADVVKDQTSEAVETKKSFEAADSSVLTSSSTPSLTGGSQLAVTENIKSQPSASAPDGGQTSFSLQPEDAATLQSHFGAEFRDTIVRMYERILQKPDVKPFVFGSLVSVPIPDKQKRTQIHQDLRRIFNGRFETIADEHFGIKIMASKRHHKGGRNGSSRYPNAHDKPSQPKGKLGWNELGGEFLHFSLYKENKDTMEAVNFLASRLNMPGKKFSFAGTKDRRAVTTQRVSVSRMRAEQIAQANKSLWNAQVGDFSYSKHGLELGELAGNEFTITLRDCHCEGFQGLNLHERMDLADFVVGEALKTILEHGFINYYGLQRFGTHPIGTDEIGKKILRGDFEGAVAGILFYSPNALAEALPPSGTDDQKGIPRDDIARAKAIHIWESTRNAHAAVEKLPRKFSAEASIIRYLGRKHTSKDFAGALLQITRNLRLMYIHAYQSLVWNMAASERWARYGNKVIKGDLIIVDKTAEEYAGAEDEVDESGEIIVRPAADDAAVTHDDLFERARPLSEDEAKSGKFSIFDIVLPTPGFDIEYPNNDIGDYYKKFMGSERGGGLDPANMRRNHKDFSLSGSYRKLMAEIGKDAMHQVKSYKDENEQMVETDLEKITKSRPVQAPPFNNIVVIPSKDVKQSTDVPSPTKTNVKFTLNEQPQGNAWQNAWMDIVAQDKAADEADAARPKHVVSPSYQQIYIERDGQNGQRTGKRETSLVPGAKIETATASDNERRGSADSGTQTVAPATANAATQTQTTLDSCTGLSTALKYTASASSLSSSNTSSVGGAKLYDVQSACDTTKGKKRRAAEILTKSNTTTADSANSTNIPPAMFDEAGDASNAKIAVIVKFQLKSSQYATMALRELMKGGVKAYLPEYRMSK
ncbi:MAG: hypothetical protein M1818_002281 [Claussenomyces sp. TS43310]|nr:MAG: hypothetical protein M1818_002281 [Claussenomyces sp. TS43310]